MISPDLNCAKCEELRDRPICTVRKCSAAHLMNPGFTPWLFAFRMLDSETLSKNGLGRKLLEEHDWDDLRSMSIFHQMGVAQAIALNEVRENKAKQARNEASIKAGATRGGKMR